MTKENPNTQHQTCADYVRKRLDITVPEFLHPPENFRINEIFGYFSPETQDFFNDLKDPLDKYLFGLNQTLRWQDNLYQEIVSNLPKQESDYDHISGMYEILGALKKNTNLKSVSYPNIEVKILLHDGGEIVTGDVSNNSTPDKKKLHSFLKKIESAMFNKVVIGQINKEFPEEAKILSQIYNEYELRNNPNIEGAAESHLVKLLDMFQSNLFGRNNIYDVRILEEFCSNQESLDNGKKIVELFLKKEITQFQKLLSSIDSASDKEQLLIFFNTEEYLLKYQDPEFGYQKIHESLEEQRQKLKNLI